MGTVYQWIQNLSVWLVLSAVILHLVPGKDYGTAIALFTQNIFVVYVHVYVAKTTIYAFPL